MVSHPVSAHAKTFGYLGDRHFGILPYRIAYSRPDGSFVGFFGSLIPFALPSAAKAGRIFSIMDDTNVLVSAALFPNGTAAIAFIKALGYPHQALTSGYVIDGMRRKFAEKLSSINRSIVRFRLA